MCWNEWRRLDLVLELTMNFFKVTYKLDGWYRALVTPVLEPTGALK